MRASRLVPTLGLLLLVPAACHDATSATRPRLQSPLVGKWELTTHFDKFSFETAAPSPPDCPSSTLYCTHMRTTTDGAYLAGLIEIKDTGSTADTVTKTVSADGTVESSFCDAVNTLDLTGCVHVSDRATKTYTGQITGAPGSHSLQVDIGEPRDAFGYNLVMESFDASFADDSIYGAVIWRTVSGRSPPTYYGTFVMKRVH